MTATIPRKLLPTPIAGEYRQQAEAFYTNNPKMSNYLAVKLQPIVKPEPKKEQTSTFQPVEIRLTLDTAKGARCTS